MGDLGSLYIHTLSRRSFLSEFSLKNVLKLVGRGIYTGYPNRHKNIKIQMASASAHKCTITWGDQSLAPGILQLLGVLNR